MTDAPAVGPKAPTNPPVPDKPIWPQGLEPQRLSQTVQWVNLMVYGDPGIGKTYFAGQTCVYEDTSPAVFVDVEGGTMSIRHLDPEHVIRVTDFKQLQQVYDVLFSGKHPYKTVVIDNLTEVQKLSMRTIMNQIVKEHPDRDVEVPSLREWGKSTEQVRRFVRAFRDLPMHVIFTAHSQEVKDETTGAVSIKPSLPGKLADEIAGFIDIVCYMNVDKNGNRAMATRRVGRAVAKDRSGNLPDIVEEPTVESVWPIIMGRKE